MLVHFVQSSLPHWPELLSSGFRVPGLGSLRNQFKQLQHLHPTGRHFQSSITASGTSSKLNWLPISQVICIPRQRTYTTVRQLRSKRTITSLKERPLPTTTVIYSVDQKVLQPLLPQPKSFPQTKAGRTANQATKFQSLPKSSIYHGLAPVLRR